MTDDSYVHDPDAFDEDAESDSASRERDAEPGGQHIDWRNWVLVAAMVFGVIVAPLLIIYQPIQVNSFVFTYLVLPLVPAFLLGAIAVWATVR